MPTDTPEPMTPDDLLAELRELCSDVGCGAEARARRLAALRRLERRLGRGDRRDLLIA